MSIGLWWSKKNGFPDVVVKLHLKYKSLKSQIGVPVCEFFFWLRLSNEETLVVIGDEQLPSYVGNIIFTTWDLFQTLVNNGIFTTYHSTGLFPDFWSINRRKRPVWNPRGIWQVSRSPDLRWSWCYLLRLDNHPKALSKCTYVDYTFWAIYNDLSRGHPKWWFSKGIRPKMALN